MEEDRPVERRLNFDGFVLPTKVGQYLYKGKKAEAVDTGEVILEFASSRTETQDSTQSRQDGTGEMEPRRQSGADSAKKIAAIELLESSLLQVGGGRSSMLVTPAGTREGESESTNVACVHPRNAAVLFETPYASSPSMSNGAVCQDGTPIPGNMPVPRVYARGTDNYDAPAHQKDRGTSDSPAWKHSSLSVTRTQGGSPPPTKPSRSVAPPQGRPRSGSRLDAFALLHWRASILKWMRRIFAGFFVIGATFGLWVAITGNCYSEFEAGRGAILGCLLLQLSAVLIVFGVPKTQLLQNTAVTVFTTAALLVLFGGGVFMCINAWWYVGDRTENNDYYGPVVVDGFFFLCTTVALGMTDFILSYQSQKKRKRNLQQQVRSQSSPGSSAQATV